MYSSMKAASRSRSDTTLVDCSGNMDRVLYSAFLQGKASAHPTKPPRRFPTRPPPSDPAAPYRPNPGEPGVAVAHLELPPPSQARFSRPKTSLKKVSKGSKWVTRRESSVRHRARCPIFK